jgi:hypothetical protein
MKSYTIGASSCSCSGSLARSGFEVTIAAVVRATIAGTLQAKVVPVAGRFILPEGIFCS